MLLEQHDRTLSIRRLLAPSVCMRVPCCLVTRRSLCTACTRGRADRPSTHLGRTVSVGRAARAARPDAEHEEATRAVGGMRVPRCLVTRRSSSRSPSRGRATDHPTHLGRTVSANLLTLSLCACVRPTPCDEAAKREAGRPTCRGVEVSRCRGGVGFKPDSTAPRRRPLCADWVLRSHAFTGDELWNATSYTYR